MKTHGAVHACATDRKRNDQLSESIQRKRNDQLSEKQERSAVGSQLPNARTIARVRQRNGLTAPRVRLAPLLPRQEYPGPQARASNELHEVDRVGPVYLQGSGHRYSIWIGKDVFDGAVGLR